MKLRIGKDYIEASVKETKFILDTFSDKDAMNCPITTISAIRVTRRIAHGIIKKENKERRKQQRKKSTMEVLLCRKILEKRLKRNQSNQISRQE
jgi:protein subunit release factor A